MLEHDKDGFSEKWATIDSVQAAELPRRPSLKRSSRQGAYRPDSPPPPAPIPSLVTSGLAAPLSPFVSRPESGELAGEEPRECGAESVLS